ncbi:MAG TPA: asparaginase [Candidatus Baltobacteraceae bacterium]|nr:asparaginase [Candidatus Baltobacteraceae bacterium]
MEVTRDGVVESIHCVAACAIDAHGRELLSIGQIDAPVYLRSTAKPFIASAIVAAGAHERFALEPAEIAVIAASHSGETFHLAAVRSILSKIGLGEDALQCGPEGAGYPADAIYNNCSGKHAGILALCKTLGCDTASYLDPDNPAERYILNVCAAMSEVPFESLHVGVDGCGVPVYATPLRNAAVSYMRLACGCGIDANHTRALKIVREAMLAFPEYVSGSGEFDAALMRAAGGRLLCKGGAEGVHGVAAINRGVGFVLKVADGNSRARSPGVIAALRMLDLLSEKQVEALHSFARPPVHNKAGRLVGEIRGITAC